MNFVIHIDPDSKEQGTTRKVIINISGANFSKTVEGVMKRLPGYTEDVIKYHDSSEYKNSAWEHAAE